MRVAIVGGGVAGLSTAITLSRLPFVSSIKIIDADTNSESKITDNTYTGLWNPALTILKGYGIDIDSKICFVNKSGYKSINGQWLAQPRKGLGKGLVDSPCLGFLKNADLLSALSASLQPSIEVIKQNLVSIDTTKNNVITVSSGTSYEVDLLIGSDGKNSTVRNCIHNDNDTLRYRGYEVYRGHSTSLFHFAYKQRISEDAFHTWGQGIRFATVPTKEGNAWFLACSKATATTNRDTRKGDHNIISKDKFEKLQHLVVNWHKPIPELLANTDNGSRGVIVCDAYGSSINSGQSLVLKLSLIHI